jgi:hypothetical protein
MFRFVALSCLALGAVVSASAQSPATAQTPAPAPSTASSLPPGPGSVILKRMCTTCHSVDMITAKRATPDDWAATVQLMVSRGADGSDEDIDILTKYLSTNFPAVGADKPATPSTAPAAGTPTSHVDVIDPHFLAKMDMGGRALAH